MKLQAGKPLGSVYIVVLFIIGSFMLLTVRADAQNCGDYKFNFYFCEGGKLVEKCVQCPNDAKYLPAKPYKRSKPCFQFPINQVGTPPSTIYDGTVPLYEPSDASSDLNAAALLWSNAATTACPTSDQPTCGSCTSVILSTNPADFNNDATLLKKDFRNNMHYNPSTCKGDCDAFSTESIIINFTNQHIYNQNGSFNRVPYNGIYHSGPSSGGGVALLDIMVEAMAGFYGFAPQNGKPCGHTSHPTVDYPWYTDGSVPTSVHSHFYAGPTVDNATICMYRRLYCPGADAYCYGKAIDNKGTGTEKPDVEISVVPNPSKGDVKCIITTKTSGRVPVRIYDEAGNVVSKLSELDLKEGSRVYRLNTNLSAGTYTLSLSLNGVNHIRRFVVIPK
ncbi:MAG: T9SS type A sorting domain-containing protein [Bacteroidota bacterium]